MLHAYMIVHKFPGVAMIFSMALQQFLNTEAHNSEQIDQTEFDEGCSKSRRFTVSQGFMQGPDCPHACGSVNRAKTS